MSKPQPVPSMIIISLLSQKQMSWPFTVCQFLEWFPDVCVSVSWMTSKVQLKRDSRIEDRRLRYRFIARLFASQFFTDVCLAFEEQLLQSRLFLSTSMISSRFVITSLISFCLSLFFGNFCVDTHIITGESSSGHEEGWHPDSEEETQEHRTEYSFVRSLIQQQ
jgi:hypothetical protein